MASAQQTLTKKSKVILDHGKLKDQDHMHATITNKTSMQMTLLKSNSWAGSPESVFPQVIGSNESVKFNHLHQGDFGSKAVVVYAGSNQANLPCAWVLAWDAPTTPSAETPNRVYVECGAKGTIDAIPLDQFKMMVEQSSDDNSDNDTTTGTMVTAKFDDKIPQIATLDATFGLM